MLNRIGILGGMGPRTTLYFLNLLFEALSENFRPVKDQDYPDISILMENSMPDRTEAVKTGDPDTAQKINRAIASLVLSGCDPVVIPSITAHALVEQRWFDAGVIDFRHSIIEHCESIYTDQIAILATEGALASDVFNPLDRHFKLIYPGELIRKKIMSIIHGSSGLKTCHPDIAECQNILNSILMEFRKAGIDYFLIGATDIEVFIDRQQIEGNFIMPMALMCEQTIESVSGGVPG